MSAWTDYLDLWAHIEGLQEREERGLAAADAAYQQESRRLQNELALAEREHKTLKDRNTRLQIAGRDVSRRLGVPIPTGSSRPPLTGADLAAAIKAAEYDIDQIRRSLDFLDANRGAYTGPPAATSPPIGAPAPTPQIRESRPDPRTVKPVWIGASVLLVSSVLALIFVLS